MAKPLSTEIAASQATSASSIREFSHSTRAKFRCASGILLSRSIARRASISAPIESRSFNFRPESTALKSALSGSLTSNRSMISAASATRSTRAKTFAYAKLFRPEFGSSKTDFSKAIFASFRATRLSSNMPFAYQASALSGATVRASPQSTSASSKCSASNNLATCDNNFVSIDTSWQPTPFNTQPLLKTVCETIKQSKVQDTKQKHSQFY